MEKIKIFMIAVFVLLIGNLAFSAEDGKIPSAVDDFIHQFYSLYNNQDYKTIYRDITTSRFRSGNDFVNFKKSINEVYKTFGPIEGLQPDFIYNDEYVYNNQEMKFYRIEYLVLHEKGETVQRIVVIDDGEKLFIDGYAVVSEDTAHFAQGNIYYFYKKEQEFPEDKVWVSEELDNVWKDSTKEYIGSQQYFSDRLKRFKSGKDDSPRALVKREYYEDGSVKWIIPYKNGRRHGTFQEFRQDGSLERERFYQDGVLKHIRKYDFEGNLISEEKFESSQELLQYLETRSQ